MANYHGGTGRVMLSSTGVAAAIIVRMSEWSLNKQTDKAEVTSFGDANKTYVQGLPDISGSLSAYFDDTDDTLFDASESTDGCKLYLYPATTALTVYHYGPAWLDASITCPVSGPVACAGNFVAKSSWGRKP